MNQKNVLGIRGFAIFLKLICMYVYVGIRIYVVCMYYVRMYELKYVYLQTELQFYIT